MLASLDEGLVTEATDAAFERGDIDLVVVDDPDELAASSHRGSVLLDARDPALAGALGRRADGRLHAIGGGDAVVLAASASVRRALEVAATLAAPRPRDAADDFLGVSCEAARVREQIRRLARFSDVSVLILGETGTGKERVAQAIHRVAFEDRPFVALNCAAVPDPLVVSELFGHTAGAFTGASGARTGLMAAAGDGTFFLDEIGEMRPDLQTALLRALEVRTFRAMGSNHSEELRARIVAATNRTHRHERQGLRPDLFYRLAGITLTLAPLRDRHPSDLRLLVRSFMRSFAARYDSSASVDEAAMRRLEDHDWPGNVRELQALVGHAAILAGGRPVTRSHVEAAFEDRSILEDSPRTEPPPMTDVRETRRVRRSIPEMERELIENAMTECGGNLSRASRLLDIPRSTLRDKLKKYEIHGASIAKRTSFA
ncbi:MAG: sigma-54-dependent Fis family transcriptional regulator [Myxococcales bacterium]|nr:sigma-54-dependent Fis family transcriptional regulator [Myxococcales bacterium]